MTAKEWRQINSALRNERCILFLGPGVSQALAKNTWQPLHQLFTQYLVEELEAEGMSYDQQLVHSMPYMVSCFMKIEGVMDTDPADEARAFYKRHSKKIPPTLQQLAQLPFSLIINTSPDDLMVKALKEVGKFQVNHNYYNFRRANKNETIPAFSSDEPLVFNLCGYFDDADSLIITEKDKSRFLKNIARNEPRVPTEITSRFDSRTFYLLLGFDLEDWKYKLLFDTLHLDDNLSAIVPSSEVFN
ncbi:MAG: SIR2 family protein, partial [Chitinophagales bacterium]